MSNPPPPPPPAYDQGGHAPPARPRNGLGTASLVLGVIGILLAVLLVGGLFGLLAIVLGVIALGRVRRGEATNRGVAIAGIVTGVVAVLIAGLIGAVVGAVWNSDEAENFRDCIDGADSDAERDDCAEEFGEDLGQ